VVEQLSLLRSLAKWTGLGTLVGILGGSASALFLFGLDLATQTRGEQPWLLWLLPVGGFLVGWVYHRLGGDSHKGNNLLLEELHHPKGRVPLRMAPLVLGGTVLTHLFGGSAGREGTAVQMGGSLADFMSRLLHLTPSDRRILLMSGISAGFGSVFGTPLAGTIFGLEVVRAGQMRYDALLACLMASFVGDAVTLAWGVGHSGYPAITPPGWSWALGVKLVIAAIAFGLASLLFARLTHSIKALMARWVPYPPLRPLVGGFAVITLTFLVGTRLYLGLGLPAIEQALSGAALSLDAFAWKTLFTAVTLGTGFQGGEVTPLFFVGAALGNALGQVLSISPGFIASLGFAAVFGAAANTPLACVVMGIELFGGGQLIGPLAIVCFLAYLVSGRHGIYASQPVEVAKGS
jgi:H+/Cl- antiporter ClcA